MSVVVDASALAAVVFDEPEQAMILARLRGHAGYAPPLIELELLNIYLKKLRRTPADAANLKLAIQDFFAASLSIREPDLMAALALAERFELSFYDACHLQL